jgi:Rieske Fe-S protein
VTVERPANPDAAPHDHRSRSPDEPPPSRGVRLQADRPCSSPAGVDRRTLFARLTTLGVAAIGSALAVLTGGAIMSPTASRPRETWVPVAQVDELEGDIPKAVTIRVTRRNGYLQEVEREVAFLVKSADGQVKALSSTCTHLGCRVTWNPALGVIACPCHGGVYTVHGEVQAGPPPSPLPRLSTRVEDGRVFVQV